MHRSAAPTRSHLEIGAGVFAGVAVATVALVVDGAVDLAPTIPTENARGLLAATFGALVTAGAFSFWMLPLAAQLAAASVPTPTVAAHLRDPFQRRVIAATLGALAYTAVAGLALPVSPDADAPTLTTLLAAVLGVGGIAALLVAIQHAVRATQPSTLVSVTADMVVQHIDRLDAECREQPRRDLPPPPIGAGQREVTVRARRTGWLEPADTDAVLADVPAGSTVCLEAPTGSFVVRDWTTVATVRGPIEDPSALQGRLARQFRIGDDRGPEADLVGSITRFTDIAVHAGSGASGAPSIVYESLRYLGAIVHALVGCELRRTPRCDGDGRRIEWRQQHDAPELATIAIDRIRQVVASDPVMAIELVRVLVDARDHAVRAGDEELVAVLDQQSDLAVDQCRHAGPLPADLERVVAARTQAQLRSAAPGAASSGCPRTGAGSASRRQSVPGAARSSHP